MWFKGKTPDIYATISGKVLLDNSPHMEQTNSTPHFSTNNFPT
jgi:hypothetical protein